MWRLQIWVLLYPVAPFCHITSKVQDSYFAVVITGQSVAMKSQDADLLEDFFGDLSINPESSDQELDYYRHLRTILDFFSPSALSWCQGASWDMK